MQVSTPVKPPQFAKRSYIVIDDTPLVNRPVERMPRLQVGVPLDEVERIGSHFNFSKSFFLGNLVRLVNRFR